MPSWLHDRRDALSICVVEQGRAAPAPASRGDLLARDFDEVGVEGGPSAHVGHAIVGENVDAPAAGMEAMPPDTLDHGDAGPGGVGEARREARGAARALDAHRVAVDDA